MRFNLLIFLLLTSVTPLLFAANFDLSKANTGKINKADWKCEKCTLNSDYIGSATLKIGLNEQIDLHASNAFGDNSDGTFYGLSSALLTTSKSGWRALFDTSDLGMSRTTTGLKVSNDQVELYANYKKSSHLNSNNAKPDYHILDRNSEQNHMDEVILKTQRERMFLGAETNNYMGQYKLTSKMGYRIEERKGNQSTSVVIPLPIFLAKPIDSTKEQITASTSLSGDNWLLELEYLQSEFNNHITDLFHTSYGNIQSQSPDNEFQKMILAGITQSDDAIFDIRVVKSAIQQKGEQLGILQNLTRNWDGKVDEFDFDARYSQKIGPRFLLQFAGRYKERDSNAGSAVVSQYQYDPLTEDIVEGILTNTKSTMGRSKLQYRFPGGYRLDSAYRYDKKERSGGGTKVIEKHQFNAGLKITTLDKWAFDVKGDISRREGEYCQSRCFDTEKESLLLRKYHTADRERIAGKIAIRHLPTTDLSLNIDLQFADDDYTKTYIGLTDAIDSSYQLTFDYLINQQISVQSSVSQQWIDSKQTGTGWNVEVRDRFISFGIGLDYKDMLYEKLNFGVNYLYTNSESHSENSALTSGPDDEYRQYRHSATLFLEQELTQNSQVRLDYQYERYYETDYAEVEFNAVPGLITLGELNHNYNAHQLTLSYKYLFL